MDYFFCTSLGIFNQQSIKASGTKKVLTSEPVRTRVPENVHDCQRVGLREKYRFDIIDSPPQPTATKNHELLGKQIV